MTRAEIEEIRGVTTSKGTLDVLLETGWIRLRGRRKAPGRPVTYGTTEAFLSHFGLEALDDLPGLDELKGAGLLDGRAAGGLQRSGAVGRSGAARRRGPARAGRSRPRPGAARRPQRGIDRPLADQVIGKRPSEALTPAALALRPLGIPGVLVFAAPWRLGSGEIDTLPRAQGGVRCRCGRRVSWVR